ncbi:SMI1/KNR4 family protein [Pseudovibrio ascidiaceicola]|uniref:SMI1/KNR4 family protein n=1 Tax=Pseudovibrio ascidiaceicola TaxID=285279 RepID=UPI003D36A629
MGTFSQEAIQIAGPCPEAIIKEAEEALRVTFPQQYRELLTNCGAGLFRAVEIYGLFDEGTNDPPTWQNVVAVTKQLREWGQVGAERFEYVAISDDGTGNYFFLDTTVSPKTKIIAVGPGVEITVSYDLANFVTVGPSVLTRNGEV